MRFTSKRATVDSLMDIYETYETCMVSDVCIGFIYTREKCILFRMSNNSVKNVFITYNNRTSIIIYIIIMILEYYISVKCTLIGKFPQ